MADNRTSETEISTGAEDLANKDHMRAGPPPLRRRGAGFAPVLAAIILLVGGFTTYTFMQGAARNEANGGQIVQTETGAN